MSRRNLFNFILIIFLTVFLSRCATQQVKKEKVLVFKNPQAEKRAEYLRAQLKTNPNNTEYHIELGKIFLIEDMVKEAITEFEKALNVDPENIKGRLLLASAIQKCPDPDLAKVVRLLEKASQISPEEADVHLHLALIYGKVKEEKKSENEFKKAIELTDDPAITVSAQLGLMAIHKRRGELEKAQAAYEKARTIYPGVDELVKQVEISRITPAPEYSGDSFREDMLHPPLEERIIKLKEKSRQISGEEK